MSRGGVLRFLAVMAVLFGLHFMVRPRFGDPRWAPDFVLVAVLFLAIRTRPGVGAAAGFLVGLALDALAPTAFGSAALAGTVVGFLGGWLKALVFADNALMTALFVLLAAWLRDAIQTLAGNQLSSGALGWQLGVHSPLAALATATAALVMLLVFRRWLGLRQGS